MVENRADDAGIFNAGDDLHGTAAGLAGFDIDAEYPLEALCPGHGHMALDWSSIRRLLGSAGLAPLITPGRSNQRPVLTVGSEHAVEAGEVDSGFGHQGSIPGNDVQGCTNAAGAGMRKSGKVQRLEENRGGTITLGSLSSR